MCHQKDIPLILQGVYRVEQLYDILNSACSLLYYPVLDNIILLSAVYYNILSFAVTLLSATDAHVT